MGAASAQFPRSSSQSCFQLDIISRFSHGQVCRATELQVLTSVPIQKVCKELLNQIRSPKNIKPVYRKLPLILGGEQSVSLDEPVKTINKHLDELEKDEKILSCSWHVGYLRHDCPEAGCGVVVVPTKEKYQKAVNEYSKGRAPKTVLSAHSLFHKQNYFVVDIVYFFT